MKIDFLNSKIREICEAEVKASRKYGHQNAKKIVLRIIQLQSADNLAIFRKVHPRTHQLIGSMKGEYAADLVGAARLIFLPDYSEVDKSNFDERDITEVTVCRIEKDYH